VADGADLFRQPRQLDVGDEVHLLAQRPEEVVVVGGDDRPRFEPGQDPLPVVLGEAAAGDSGEEDVDAPLADRIVDQVGAALVVEAEPGDRDRDSPDLAAAVGAGRERVEVVAAEFAVVWDREAEQQLRVQAGGEGDLERTQLVGPVGLDLDRPLGLAVERHQVDQRARAVGRAIEALGERRRVERVVEVVWPTSTPTTSPGAWTKRSSAAGSGSAVRRRTRSRNGTRER
jgi:hypothetical protein